MKYAILLVCICLLAGCSKSNIPVSSTTGDAEKYSGQGKAAPVANATSDAEKYSHQVKATLDVTTLEGFCAQMPDTIQPEMRWGTGKNRVFTWMFRDGSKIIATFQATAIPGGGLVLYMVEITK